jgi:hypothetical protein
LATTVAAAAKCLDTTDNTDEMCDIKLDVLTIEEEDLTSDLKVSTNNEQEEESDSRRKIDEIQMEIERISRNVDLTVRLEQQNAKQRDLNREQKDDSSNEVVSAVVVTGNELASDHLKNSNLKTIVRLKKKKQ